MNSKPCILIESIVEWRAGAGDEGECKQAGTAEYPRILYILVSYLSFTTGQL